MKYIYKLEILSSEEYIQKIYDQLKISTAKITSTSWRLELTQNENDDYIYFITIFVGIISKNINHFKALNIKPEDITVWVLYAYKDQCNMEFSPEQMNKLCQFGITLCISCWEDD